MCAEGNLRLDRGRIAIGGAAGRRGGRQTPGLDGRIYGVAAAAGPFPGSPALDGDSAAIPGPAGGSFADRQRGGDSEQACSRRTRLGLRGLAGGRDVDPGAVRCGHGAHLRAVLLHELAHIARHDCWTLAMAELAVALYWFHPLAWWAASRMRRERERACDDRVLAAGITASGYATDLLEVARGRLDAALPAPAMARASNLEARLRAILDPTVRRRDMGAKAVGVVAAAAFLVLAPLAALRLHGQDPGSLAGTIYDASGARVVGATVAILNTDTGQAQATTSSLVGNFSFSNLPGGQYQVMVSSPGFALYARRAVSIPATLDVFLSVGPVSESVTVSGKGPHEAPRPGPQRMRVGGNVQFAKLLQQAKPVYPASAQAAGIQGTVLLRAVIGTDGRIMGLTVSSSPDPTLSDAAMESARQWRYQPTLLNGEPVEVLTTISVNFRLDQ
jgi:TonB family protein